MTAHLRPAFVLLVLMTLITGIAYPLAMTGIAQLAFPAMANGSLIDRNGTVVGSALIGQMFTQDKYFWPRPSATTDTDPNDPTKTVPVPYNAAASGGSNKGPTAKDLIERVTADAEKMRTLAGNARIPVDAITTSGSGLDPHITPENAYFQAARVAKARGIPEAKIRDLIARQTEGRTFGILGEPRVNVLLLNISLDSARTPNLR